MIVKLLRLSPNNISIKNNINNRNRPPNAKKYCKENKKQRKTNLPPLNFSNLLRCINQISSNNKNKEENENYYRITKNQKHPPFNKIIKKKYPVINTLKKILIQAIGKTNIPKSPYSLLKKIFRYFHVFFISPAYHRRL